MLLASSNLLDTPIMSLQTGDEIARTTTAIVNPYNLHILAYQVEGSRLDVRPSFIRIEDIRELSDVGFIVDSSESLTILDDLVTEKDFYENPMQIEGMRVVDDNNHKLGRVAYTTMDTDTFRIEKLNIKQSILKRLSSTELLINRKQIIDITGDTITVRSPREHTAQPIDSAPAKPFVNPFRGSQPPQPESIKSDRQ